MFENSNATTSEIKQIDIEQIDNEIIQSINDKPSNNQQIINKQSLTIESTNKQLLLNDKHNCYSDGHFISYTTRNRLRFMVCDDESFNSMLIQSLKRFRYGGYHEDKYIKLNPNKTETPPLIITKVKCIGGCRDTTNENFTHNFIEFHYYGDKQYNNLVDTITTNDYVKRFNNLLYLYDKQINKGLHCINDEIKRLGKR